MFFCGFAKFFSVPLNYFSFLLNLFPCANDSGLFHLGGFHPESGDSLDVHSHWRRRSKNLICGFALRCVGKACQLVNFTDRDQVASQPFQGGTPNGIFCRSFLCSHSVPPGRNLCSPTRQNDAWLPVKAGAGWQNYYHSMTVSADFPFPSGISLKLHSYPPLCMIFRVLLL